MNKFTVLISALFAFNLTFAAVTDISPIGKVRTTQSGVKVLKKAKTSKINPAKIYTASCSACHNSGVAGAPVVGNKQNWQPRIASGIKALYKSAINGKGAMPPKGGAMHLSDAEVKHVVSYMIKKSK